MERVLSFDHDLPVSIEAMTVDSFPSHYHEDMQIVYVLKGEVDLRLIYMTYNLKAGDMHFVHRYDIHSLKGVTEDNLVLLFNFNVEAFSSLYPDFYMQIFTTRVSKDFVTYERKLRLRDNMFRILSEIIELDPGFQGRVYDLSNEMLRILYKDFRGFFIDAEKGMWIHTVSSDPVQIDRISRVVNFVYDNYPYKLNLNEIAESEHISKFYLSHLFQKYVGPSFRDFVAMVRVEMSEHQILNSDMPITRVAQECGFSHPKYFIEHFKNWFGYHPAEYRKKFKETTINYVEPSVTQIPLENLFKYQDVSPMYEDNIDSGDRQFASLHVPAGARVEQKIPWSNVLEPVIDSSILSNPKAKSMYLEFYEDIIEKGIKTSVSQKGKSVVDDDAVDSKNLDYFKHNPHVMAIQKLESIFNECATGKRPKWKPDFMDLIDSKNGLISKQGLKKPAYFLFMMLSEMYDSVIKVGKNHMVCKEDDNIKILMFNGHAEDMSHLDIIFEDMEGAYRLTELRLSSDICFVEQLKQLDYKKQLSSRECQIINSTSFPKGRFETIPDITQFVYHCDMKPLEILHLGISKI